MLMRDFGFNIYKEIYRYKENTGNENTTVGVGTEKLGSGGTKDDLNDKGEDKSKSKEITKNNNSIPDEHLSKEHDDDSQSQKLELRKHKSYPNDKDNQDNRSTSKDGKMIVVKPELLLSFIYFDVSYCGYIFDKDLEDLFLLLGLNLSRSQVKKYLSKLSSRQAIYYR